MLPAQTQLTVMNPPNGSIPFGQRLNSLLECSGNSQAWLAERANLERSTISRLVRGDRNPTIETLQLLAGVLGISIKELVEGTDAEARLEQATDLVRRQDYDATVQKLLEQEGRVQDLELELRAARRAHDQEHSARVKVSKEISQVQFRLETTTQDLADERARTKELSEELQRHRLALQKAVGEVSSLRGQLKDLAEEVRGTAVSSRTAAILAGVAAAAGVVTAASYLANSNNQKASDGGTRPGNHAGRKSRT